MSQASQSTPMVTANLGGANHQVNLRDYLNIRVAPFIKKAITESLEASPEFPLQWLGENLIHQSMLYEGNPDSTKIRERFLYNFETPVAATPSAEATGDQSAQPQMDVPESGSPAQTTPLANGATMDPVDAQDTQMSNHVNGNGSTAQAQPSNESRDMEMTETSQE